MSGREKTNHTKKETRTDRAKERGFGVELYRRKTEREATDMNG